MSSPRLPLPLELTKPVLLAGDVNTLVRGTATSRYDPKTQLCSDSSCDQNCESFVELISVDVTFDGIMIDDISLF
jgi:hypothetical protein